MFLVVAVLPVLLASLLRLFALVFIFMVGTAVTNPSDRSFAHWINSQENVRVKDNASATQWVSAMFKTAMAIVRNESLTWTFYNAICFSVVYVPSLERYAFGCCGTWLWADTNAYLSALCKKPWIKQVSRGGYESCIDNHLSGAMPMPASGSYRRKNSDRSSSMRSRMASGALSADGFTTGRRENDRLLRAKALQYRMNQEWTQAASYFMEAAAAAVSALTKSNCQLEAAWCILEDSATYPSSSSQLMNIVEAACEVSLIYPTISRSSTSLAHRNCRRVGFSTKLLTV